MQNISMEIFSSHFNQGRRQGGTPGNFYRGPHWTEGEFALKEKTEPRDIKFPFPRFALGRNTLKGFLFQFENIFPGQFRSRGPIMYIKKENEGDEEE